MEKDKRIKEFPSWKQPKSRFPGVSLQKEEKTPVFYLAVQENEEDHYVSDVYFINNTDETLEFVSSGTGGFQTCDEDIVSVQGKGLFYQKVIPGEAVLVESYHCVSDSDFVLELNIEVLSQVWGKLEFKELEKGGFGAKVLMWKEDDIKK